MEKGILRKTHDHKLAFVLSSVLLTIILSIMLSNDYDILNLTAEAQTLGNNTVGASPSNNGLDISELFTKVEGSVVQVTDPNTPGLLGPRLGSGFVYDSEGHIITNNHVVAGGNGDLDVTFLDGNVYNAKLVGADPYADLAVLKVEGVPKDKLVPLPLGNSSSLKIGQPVAAVGNPFGLSGSLTEGIVSGLGRSLPSSEPQEPTNPQLDIPLLPESPTFSIPDIIQTDAAINPGNSGGPLLNTRGEVIGINSAIFSTTGAYSGVGFAISSNMIKKVVPSLITTGSYTHPYIGITGIDVTPDIAKAMGLQEARGFLITGIIAGGPSDKAGIRGGYIVDNFNGTEIQLGGDVVVKIDNMTVANINDILTYLNSQRKVGDTVQLTVLRDGQLQQIPVTLVASSSLPEFANPESPLQQPDKSLPPPSPSEPPDNDKFSGNLYDECVKLAGKETCDLLFRR
jgi:S1-C subfamily serine protease